MDNYHDRFSIGRRMMKQRQRERAKASMTLRHVTLTTNQKRAAARELVSSIAFIRVIEIEMFEKIHHKTNYF